MAAEKLSNLLIVSCTRLKHGDPNTGLIAANFSRKQAPTRVAKAWKKAIADAKTADRSSGKLKPAAGRYKGGYWSKAQMAAQEIAKQGGRTMVVSAGLGLVGIEEEISCYDATFSAHGKDRVPGAETLAGRQKWWELIGGSDRLRAELRQTNRRKGKVLCAVPASYLAVIGPDLEQASKALGEDLVIVTAESDVEIAEKFGLENHLAPASAWLTRTKRDEFFAVAGSITGCAALFLLNKVRAKNLTPKTATRALDRLKKTVPDWNTNFYPKRIRQTPEAVREWIQQCHESETLPGSKSAALKKFRGQGLGFEQKHFGRIFEEVKESLGELP